MRIVTITCGGEWLPAVERLQARLPRDVALHVGHGPAAGKDRLAPQCRYIETSVESVAEHADTLGAGDNAW